MEQLVLLQAIAGHWSLTGQTMILFNISYPCCENGVWQAVCEEPAGIAQGCQDTGHLLVRQDIHLYLTKTSLMINKLLKLYINQGHWSLTSQMMIQTYI